MFEEICLVCGRHLKDDGRAYCNDDCQSRDISSPSISSSSSASPSPKLDVTHGGDVPALVPSALGSALKSYAGRKGGNYVSSSSASSTSWSTLTDEEDEVSVHNHGAECIHHDKSDPICGGGSQSANFIHAINPSALLYARRPSGTNNPSTVPGPLKYVRGVPRSVPNGSHSSPEDEDEDTLSDVGFSSDALDDHELESEKGWNNLKPKYSGVKTKRTRNRASLPAYFSLLQMTSPSKGARSSPASSSYGTVARLSPPTPKLALSTGFSQLYVPPTNPQSTVHTTPRGRQREDNKSRSSRRSGHSSHSRSRSRRVIVRESPQPVEHAFPACLRSEAGLERDLDMSALPGVPNRGRTAMRQNSSPAPRALMGGEEPSALVAALAACMADGSPSDSRSRPRTRGRARVDELDGHGLSADAPGYGNGRSGLVNRERAIGSHHARVPL